MNLFFNFFQNSYRLIPIMLQLMQKPAGFRQVSREDTKPGLPEEIEKVQTNYDTAI
jgi:hypothetical protein